MMLETQQKWWQNTVFYQIYIASFQDSNGDGIGDFNGLTSRLDYLQDLGVNGLWITPFYLSPKVDNGYDVADYFTVDPDFGCLADFDHFIAEAHRRDMKVIIDVVLNHVSTQHRWFRDAVTGPDSQYRDYFFFQDSANGWQSFFGGSAWHKEPNGDQLYYHKFSTAQADLNWQNAAVRDEMRAMLQFWLERGVDGFRFDVINFLSCDGIGDDNPAIDRASRSTVMILISREYIAVLPKFAVLSGIIVLPGDWTAFWWGRSAMTIWRSSRPIRVMVCLMRFLISIWGRSVISIFIRFTRSWWRWKNSFPACRHYFLTATT